MGERKPSPYRARMIEKTIAKEIRVNGILYHYWDKGSGPPLLMLHGFGGSAYDWHTYIDTFADAGYRVIVPDLPGSGYSDRPEDLDYSIPGLMKCILQFTEALNLPPFHLMGSSFGGGIALRIAVNHPQKVSRMILFDAAAIAQKIPVHVRVLRWPIVNKLATRIPPRTFIVGRLMKDIYFDHSKINQEAIKEYAYEQSFPGGDHAMEKIAQALDMEEIRSFSERFGEITLPTLIFWGKEDTITFFEGGKELHSRIPGSLFRPFSNCGHCPHVEYPEETVKESLYFLTSDPPSLPK